MAEAELSVFSFPNSLAVVAALGLSIGAPCIGRTENARITVAVSSTTPAFEEAVASFKTAVRADGYILSFVATDGSSTLSNVARSAPSRLGVAFGTRAVESLASSDVNLPLLVTMVLDGEGAVHARTQKNIPTVSLSISPAMILSRLRSTLPGKKTIAVLLSPATISMRSELLAAAQRLGFVLEIVECAGPRDVLDAFGSLRGRVDFVWCLPDSRLFPAAAIPPIVLASIRNRLPVIGFSEGFVRAGATIGFYPDYAEIGVQTAQMVKHYLAGQEPARVEAPRKIRVAVNDRVLRILGFPRLDPSSELTIIR
jgi:ABC-type uncharacterized transport system substrate-binding protein